MVLHFIHGKDLPNWPALTAGMFRDRADQFKARLDWDVTVDSDGFERDAYDALNPLYVIWTGPDGSHQGSMRFLPCTGRTMVNEHFSHVCSGRTFFDAQIWECTRFCQARGASSRVAAALFLGGGAVLRHAGAAQFVGVFDARMIRIYHRLGWSPEVLGSIGEGRDKISVGLWHAHDEDRQRIAARAGIAPDQADRWFEHSPAAQRIEMPTPA